MSQLQIILGILLCINIFTLFVMAYDKRRSVKEDKGRRISEGLMFFMAAAFGSLGVYLGMWLFRHKIRKWYFQLGIPLVIAQNFAAIYLIIILFIQ